MPWCNDEAYVAEWENRCVVAIDGTCDFPSLVTDLKVWKSGTTWSECGDCGVVKELQNLQQCIQQTVSEGDGAVAGRGYRSPRSVVLGKLRQLDGRVHAFGVPRTESAIFANDVNARFSDRFFRVTHHEDPVVQILLRLLHRGQALRPRGEGDVLSRIRQR